MSARRNESDNARRVDKVGMMGRGPAPLALQALISSYALARFTPSPSPTPSDAFHAGYILIVIIIFSKTKTGLGLMNSVLSFSLSFLDFQLKIMTF